jgi:hypothetical protein
MVEDERNSILVYANNLVYTIKYWFKRVGMRMFARARTHAHTARKRCNDYMINKEPFDPAAIRCKHLMFSGRMI